MTIAFGVACDDGVLLATDSLSQLHRLDGWIEVTFGRKVDVLGDHAAYVVSGHKPDEWSPAADWAELPVVDLASKMLGELSLFAGTPIDGRQPAQHVLVGGRSAEGKCGLVLVGTDRALLEARPRGRPLVGGAMRDWAESAEADFGTAPPTLADALPYALECCRRYIRESWAGWGFERLEDFHIGEPGGYVPSSAPPYHVAIITSTEIQTLEVPQ
jgi:hypothetical protein